MRILNHVYPSGYLLACSSVSCFNWLLDHGIPLPVARLFVITIDQICLGGVNNLTSLIAHTPPEDILSTTITNSCMAGREMLRTKNHSKSIHDTYIIRPEICSLKDRPRGNNWLNNQNLGDRILPRLNIVLISLLYCWIISLLPRTVVDLILQACPPPEGVPNPVTDRGFGSEPSALLVSTKEVVCAERGKVETGLATRTVWKNCTVGLFGHLSSADST